MKMSSAAWRVCSPVVQAIILRHPYTLLLSALVSRVQPLGEKCGLRIGSISMASSEIQDGRRGSSGRKGEHLATEVTEFALLACPWRGICWAVFGLSSARLTGKEGAVQSIHSFCGKPCGKKGHEDWNSLISNEKDQAAHKSVYYCKLLKLQALIKFSEIRVPVGKDSSASPAKTGFSTIGLREWPTGRGFWESGPCRSNSCGAFVRMDVNKRCQPCVRSSHGRAPTLGQGWDTSVRKWEMAASVDQIV